MLKLQLIWCNLFVMYFKLKVPLVGCKSINKHLLQTLICMLTFYSHKYHVCQQMIHSSDGLLLLFFFWYLLIEYK